MFTERKTLKLMYHDKLQKLQNRLGQNQTLISTEFAGLQFPVY